MKTAINNATRDKHHPRSTERISIFLAGAGEIESNQEEPEEIDIIQEPHQGKPLKIKMDNCFNCRKNAVILIGEEQDEEEDTTNRIYFCTNCNALITYAIPNEEE